ncbi:unnamed protein product [Merluccius merluccius]
MATLAGPTASPWLGKLVGRLPRLRRPHKRRAQNHVVVPLKEEPSFGAYLDRGQLSRAAEQLIAREERLFGRGDGEVEMEVEAEVEMEAEVEAARLAADRDALASRVRLALSCSLGSGDAEALRSAVDAVRRDEEQDRRWQHQGGRSPPKWRPGGMRTLHDAALRELVERRMDGASTPTPAGDGAASGQSSVQQELCGYGRQIRGDLGLVVRAVRGCYPAEMDVCNLYARLYHGAFSARLAVLADFGLHHVDCSTILRWVNGNYPDILTGEVLGGHVDYGRLGPLLPQDLYSPLESQYLSTTQEEVKRRLKLFLKEEEEVWKRGALPTTTEGCFHSPLAIDVLQCIDGAVRATEYILGDQRKAQEVVCLLSEFLDSLGSFLSNVMQTTAGNSKPVLLAHLTCLQQFRDYIVKQADLFPADVKERCVDTLRFLKESPHYRTVGTSSWLKKSLLGDLLLSLELHIRDLQGPSGSCREELVGQLQVEVTVEYVKRLLKGNLRLKATQHQEQAAQTVSEDAKRLTNMFSGAGSRECWLDGIMSQLAEVLKLQDLPCIQLVVASMGMAYPDLSSKHISSLLKLKCSLTRSDREMVQKALDDCRKQSRTSDPTPPPFFSRVHLK